MVFIKPFWFEIPSLLASIEVSGEISLIEETTEKEKFILRYPEGVVEYDPSTYEIKTNDLIVHTNVFHWLSDTCHPATVFAALVNAAYSVVREGVECSVIVETYVLDDYGVETPYYYNDKESANIELPNKIIARIRMRAEKGNV